MRIRRDNPGGEWLGYEREAALRGYDPEKQGIRAKGFVGSITAWTYGTYVAETAAFKDVTGVNNERRGPGDHQYEALLQSVAEKGWDADQQGSAILVGVNHFGDAYVIEGNTRLAYALANGIEDLRVDIRWYNGAEDVEGPFKVVSGIPQFVNILKREKEKQENGLSL